MYKARDLETGDVVAIKQFKQHFNSLQDALVLREVSFLRKLRHPNIVRLIEILFIEPRLYLVYEFLDTDLLKFYTHYKNSVK